MTITNFTISSDRTQIDLIITDAATVTVLNFWDQSTYKDYSLSIDLTSKLTGAITENITLSLGDLGISYFDGVYFIEAQDPDETSISVTSDLTRYKECILNKVLEISTCVDCLKENSSALLNSQTLLHSLETSINNSFIDEILLITRILDKYCSDECQSCGSYKNIIDSEYYTS